jgi:hypothetical protein
MFGSKRRANIRANIIVAIVAAFVPIPPISSALTKKDVAQSMCQIGNV